MRILIFLSILFLGKDILWAQDAWIEVIKQLKHKDPALRIAAAQTLGENGVKTAVWWLIEALKDEEEPVRLAVASALKKITHLKEDPGIDYKKWISWWNKEGVKRFYPFEVLRKEDIEPLRKELDELRNITTALKFKIKHASRNIRTAVIVISVVGFLFLMVIIYFAALASSKLKSWKETIKQADFFVKKSEEITARTDKIIDELESKKLEIAQFFSKQREESQNEVERFTELLQTNLEHRMREILVELREKAEGELNHSFGELKVQIEHEIRKMLSEFKEKSEKYLKEKEDALKDYIESHKMFIEGSFYAINGKFDKALKEFNKLLSLHPKHFLALVNKGNVLKELSRYEDALEAYQAALEISPEDPSLLYNIGSVYAILKRKDKMLQYLAKSFQNDGEYKDEALNDLTFKEYWNDPAFKDLLEI
jgi:tetratricopeptide (TPR) repeat protein